MQILLAEDDLTTRTSLTGILKKWGYEATVVQDGQAAWEILQQPGSPRLVILDWVMPNMDGLEVIQQVRSRLIEQPPYIILLTGKGGKSDVLTGLESGANDYIKKPFDPEELYARIRVGERTIDLQTNLYETRQTLAHLATHDPLTGIMNRRAILEQLSKELARARRAGPSGQGARLSIGFIDIDNFKQINDLFGHQAGDDVLNRIANILTRHLRAYDTLGRLGGDEFLVVAVGTDGENCKHLFDRLLNAVASCKLTSGAGDLSVSVSIGVAQYKLNGGVDKLLETADAAMFRAKRQGANCIIYAE